MLKMTRTIWLTCTTLIAITLSSAASCAALIPIQIDTSSQFTEIDSATNVLFSTLHCDENQSTEKFETVHHYCSAMCLLSFPVTQTNSQIPEQPHTLALIRAEYSSIADTFARALYKPPIA